MNFLGILSGRRIRHEIVSLNQALEEISAREHVHFSALVLEGSMPGLGSGIRKALPHYLGYGHGRDIAALLNNEVFEVRTRQNKDTLTYPGIGGLRGELTVARFEKKGVVDFYMDATFIQGGQVRKIGYTVIDFGAGCPC